MSRNRKPLIALLTNNDDDIYCFRLELIEALIESGYQVLISCPYGPKFELMKGMNYIYDDPYIDRRGMNIVNDLKLINHYRKLMKKYRPDLVLTYTAKPNVYATLLAKHLGIPVINNVTGFGSILKEKVFRKQLIMHLFKTAYKRSSCIMFQNKTNMKIAKKAGMVRGNYKLIPGSGVNTERFPLQNYPAGGNGIEGETVVFNYIGRVLHDKGVDDYIEAAKRIKKLYPNTEFNIIGFIEPTENHYEKKLKYLQKQGVVYYRGSQKDVRPWIKRSHAIIHPSTYGEGMSNVLLENASSGRPIITTDNPGCRETVIDEISGYIYQGGNTEALAAVLLRFLKMSNLNRKLMGERGRQFVIDNFSRKIVIDTYLDEIDKLYGNSIKRQEK